MAFDLAEDGRLQLLTGPSGDDGRVYLVSIQEGVARSQLVSFAPNFVCPG